MSKYYEITKDTTRGAQYFEDKAAFTLGPVELEELMKERPDDVILVDVRDADSYKKGHIPKAINLPASHDFEMNFDKLSKEKITVVYCYNQNCHMGAKIAAKLAANGYPVMELDGAYDWYKSQGNKVEK